MIDLKGELLLCDFLVLAALRQEAELLRKKLDGAKLREIGARRAVCGFLHGHSMALAISGVGQLNAERAARDLAESIEPKALVSVGFAGALREGIGVGDIVVADKLIINPPLPPLCNEEALIAAPEYRPSKRLFSQAMAAAAKAPFPCHAGLTITVKAPICTSAGKKEAGAISGAISVDMESASIAQVAMEGSREFISLRCISDGLMDELPELGGAFSEDSAPGRLRIAARLAARPRSWPALLKLRLNYAVVRKNLFLFLDEFFRIGAAPKSPS